MTTKEKIDNALGLTSGNSIESFLSDLDIETNSVKETFNSIDKDIKDGLASVDEKLEILTSDGTNSDILALKDINLSMREVEDLIGQSKQIYKHITESILATDLVDAELINAAAKLLESIHINVAEFIQLYKDKQKFVDKIKFAIFQQQQKKDMILLKHKLDMEKIQAKGNESNGSDTVNVDGDVMPYNTDDIAKILKTLAVDGEFESD